ncbi:MAG: MarR family transcriptional regulator [Cryobacterium sp.]|jgi:DNA-binding MarR family transcriptional regulator|nr:MarR family transcriptional regulator [Cryobacterium sp.]
MPESHDERQGKPDPLIDPRTIDPDQALIDRNQMSEKDMEEAVAVLAAVRKWREAEQRMSDESRHDMKLGDNDMKAMRFIIVSTNQGKSVTPGMIADHLGISTASTTKLLDRLEIAGHVTRAPHPTDRRAVVITVNPAAHAEVQEKVGRMHARRFQVAAALSASDKRIVIRFLDDLSATAAAPDPVGDAPTSAKVTGE